MSLGVQGIHHIGVSVPDIQKARHFYIDLLGGVEEVPPLEWRDNAFHRCHRRAKGQCGQAVLLPPRQCPYRGVRICPAAF